MPEIEFELKGNHIELYKLLKVTGLCESGADAKHAVAEGKVKVNDKPETRKAFKIMPGYAVEFDGQVIRVQ